MSDILINFKKSGDEIVIGALREIGGAAVNFLGEAAGAALDFAKDSFAGALEASQGMADLDAALKRASNAATEQAAAFTAAAGKNITGTAASQAQLNKWADELVTAQAKLTDMNARLADKTPTETQKLALADLQNTVASLTANIESGSKIITTNMADALGLVAPAAVITKDEIIKLSDQFKNLVGGSDDAVIAMATIGLRFDKISKDTFPNFIERAADLATVLKIGPEQAATILGKTLQDLSTDGTASLGRLKAAGVQFTKAQEDQIAALVKSGKTAEAQKILLDALAATTGGAAAAQAETLAGKWAIFQETIADAGEGIAMKLLPPLSKLFDEVIAPNIPIVVAFAEDIAGWVESFLAAGGGMETLAGQAQTQLALVIAALQPVIDAAMNVWAAFQSSMPMIQAAVQVMADFVMAKINELMPTLIANVSSALNSIAEFWNAHGAQIMAVITLAFEFIATTIGATLTLVSGIIAAFLKVVNGDWEGAWQTIQDTFKTVMDSILSLVGTNLDEFIATWKGVFDQALLIVTTILGQIGTALLGGLQSAIDGAWSIISGVSAIGTAIIDGIKSGVTNAAQGLVDAAKGAVSDAVQAAKNLLGIHSPSTVFAGMGKNMMLGMAQGISSNSGAPALAMAGASSSVVNVGGISISGAGNPQAVAAAVKSELDRMGRSADTRMRTR